MRSPFRGDYRFMKRALSHRALSGALGIVLAGTFACVGSHLPLVLEPVAAPAVWRGDTTHSWGSAQANPCVTDVSGALEALPRRGRAFVVRLGDDQVLGSQWSRHAQGVARLPDAHGTLIISRSGDGVGALIVRPDPEYQESGGGDLRAVITAPQNLDHGGGIQTLGSVLLLPFENKRDPSAVLFYDLADPDWPRLLHRFDRIEEPKPSNRTHASNAAAARLADGRILLVVGSHSSRALDFYVSNDRSLADPLLAWTRVTTLYREVVTGMQTTALVTQCDGTLFFLGVTNTRFPPPANGRDLLHWYRVDVALDGTPRLVLAGRLHMQCEHCNFAAGAGPYVDAAGGLRLYAVPHADRDGELMVEEFATHSDATSTDLPTP